MDEQARIQADECDRCGQRVAVLYPAVPGPRGNQMLCRRCYRREIESFGVPEMLYEFDMEDDE